MPDDIVVTRTVDAPAERVWDLVGDDAAFGAYVTAEARGYLEES